MIKRINNPAGCICKIQYWLEIPTQATKTRVVTTPDAMKSLMYSDAETSAEGLVSSFLLLFSIASIAIIWTAQKNNL